jgi:hypothetical protein
MIDDKDRQRYQSDGFIVAYPGLGHAGAIYEKQLELDNRCFQSAEEAARATN